MRLFQFFVKLKLVESLVNTLTFHIVSTLLHTLLIKVKLKPYLTKCSFKFSASILKLKALEDIPPPGLLLIPCWFTACSSFFLPITPLLCQSAEGDRVTRQRVKGGWVGLICKVTLFCMGEGDRCSPQ